MICGHDEHSMGCVKCARGKALEEAAKVCENPKGVVSRDYIRYAESTVAPEIRAMKSKP